MINGNTLHENDFHRKSHAMRKVAYCIVVLIPFFGVFLSCTQPGPVQPASPAVTPDSLIKVWNLAWNTRDAATLSNLLTEQSVVVFSAKDILMGRDSIMANWISRNLPMTGNLKTEKISGAATADMAYYSGSYTLDIMANDSIVGSEPGIFTAIWKREEDQHWKIGLMFFGESGE